jgi:ribonucleoside-diphosphate reductase alpha chain
LITVDKSRNAQLSEQSKALLEDYYTLEGEDIQDAFARASTAYSGGDGELAQRIYDYASRGWFMFSSPILSNAPKEGEIPKGMPISCFLSYVPDTLEGLIEHQEELAWLSVKGGGVGGHWSDVRAVSDKAPSPIPFMKVADSAMTAYKQGKTRKGSYAAYLDVSHPDIMEFLDIRLPTGGDANRKCFNLNNAVNVTDEFMEKVSKNELWDLVDPHDGEIRDIVSARKLWEKILEVRFRTGEPYINYIDEANRQLPKSLKAKGLKIHGSNLCNEIHLPTSPDRTAVCCLSSVNLEKYEEWTGSTMFIGDLIRMLDNVLTEFITHAPPQLHKAVRSAIAERSLGLGAMGFHALLQQKGLPFESAQASGLNRKIFMEISSWANKATVNLAHERGAYKDGLDTEMRNSHLLAIAPNANSSMILSTSPSIEPWKSNAFAHRTRVGTHLIKNKYLERKLWEVAELYGHDSEWVEKQWDSVIHNEGSVQQLDCLSPWDKSVFKTAFELDQHWVVQHAADRQPYICQGQSVNLFFPAGVERQYVNSVHLDSWKKKLKGLYYLRTSSGHTAEQVGLKVKREALKDFVEQNVEEGCLSCEG